MNRQLFEAYKNLSDTRRAEIKHRYKDSPIGLKLMEFLALGTNPNFKTAEAVGHIYQAESTTEKYSVLENRYFKLRKKLLDELQEETGSTDIQDLPEEEALLNRCKHLIATGEKKEAYKLLTGLEKLCWERNLFELLPSVLDNMVFCNQGFNELQKNEELYARLEKAIELQYDLNRALMFIRQVYEGFYTKGMGHVKNLLLALKEMGDKHKEYPRFIMFYHFVSLSNKLSSMDYAQNMQVISRHLAEFRKLYDKHPMVPMVIYKAHHNKLFHFHYTQFTTLYYTNRAEFEEAYISMKEMWNMANSGDPLFRTYKVDPIYFNMFTVQCITGRYKEAYDTCNAYAAFIKETGRTDKLLMVNMMRAFLYATAFPQTFRMDIAYLMEQADAYIQSVKKNDAVQLPLAQAMLVKAEVLMLQKDHAKALRIIADKKVTHYLHSINADDLFGELISSMRSGSREKLLALEKTVAQRRHKALQIDEFITFNWLSSFVSRALKAG